MTEQRSNAFFPSPNELVCIRVPNVFDQVSHRECLERTLVLTAGPGRVKPFFTYDRVGNFRIMEVKMASESASPYKPGYKKIRLCVKLGYIIYYTDGLNRLVQPDKAVFSLLINSIYCPVSPMIRISYPPVPSEKMNSDGVWITVEAMPEAFNGSIDPVTGVFAFNIGAFFIVKSERVVPLLMPSYGYCPIPPEQNAPPN